MVERNMLLLDVNKPNKNGRLFTKNVWDSLINSELNEFKAIPLLEHPTENTSIPMDKVLGMAQCSWFGEDVNISMKLLDNTFVNATFAPAFEVDAADVNHVDGIAVIDKAELKYFYVTDSPAFNTLSNWGKD